MTYLDPTIIRLSDTLLLSDVMGCDSVYRYGYSNKFDEVDQAKLKEGQLIASLLDAIQDKYGPFSVCYGYVSQDLSRKIVKYQDPNKPSYHMWNLGAALDVCFHQEIKHRAPIYTAYDIDNTFNYGRMITYSESEWLCIGAKIDEQGHESRKRFYENRYMGVKKPKWIQYSDNANSRASQKANMELIHKWKGIGYPQYHGGGRQQFEHMRVSEYTHVNDFLYDKYLVHRGIKNLPLFTQPDALERWKECASGAGRVIDRIAEQYKTRVSITRAYNAHTLPQKWVDRYTLEIVPPTFLDAEDLADFICGLEGVDDVFISKHKEPRIQISGERI